MKELCNMFFIHDLDAKLNALTYAKQIKLTSSKILLEYVMHVFYYKGHNIPKVAKTFFPCSNKYILVCINPYILDIYYCLREISIASLYKGPLLHFKLFFEMSKHH